ncbi:CRISPR-associated protein Cas6 [Caldanaerobacter subterraneus subsp. yonseiensis KB-1]|uniref:CRISPR-associated protein Cas6 n=1 Tax=Caldanaerobacter subterraneus subsp. yonseiensis KB-1 TaxID=1388761 RepID=U5CTM6_CALSX|nr:CRISPR-associated endoribonuclease Cas6 [Caldanaerobacter subterraneus]ERM91452.1 CRISPR-associated protein Cas6 [Caldanaerobacter subterraneus subsp. yonseiensis KB-1]
MRAKFIFEIINPKTEIFELPIYYRTFFMSFIKEALSEYNQEYFKKLYWWEGKKNKWQKPFVFAVNLFNMNFTTDNKVLFRGDIVLNLSTSDYEFFINIYNSLINNPLYPYNLTETYKIKLKRTYLVKEPEEFNTTMAFKTFSPILIEKKEEDKKMPVLPFDERFEEVFNDVVDFEIRNIRLLRGQNKGLQKKLTFKPINIKKTVIKHRISEFIENTKKDYMYLTGFSGLFELSGDPEDLRELYLNGIGFRRGQGFGFIEVAK